MKVNEVMEVAKDKQEIIIVLSNGMAVKSKFNNGLQIDRMTSEDAMKLLQEESKTADYYIVSKRGGR